ncbi:MAG: hypothetical protein JWP97_3810 [Labilithrix sp.]|nr:hypothetical protein [Labilithrix sp.]
MILPDPDAPHVLPAWRLGETFSELPPRPFAWVVVGYDVCDEVGLSGLTNCGTFDAAERAARARTWAPALNAAHLFDALERAHDFRIERNALVPEHAPFLVHRLYASPQAHARGVTAGAAPRSRSPASRR